ncbi:thioredoxin family protein [Formosa agariphila]|nr:thioredoxin family protein [Formosa agariphila]
MLSLSFFTKINAQGINFFEGTYEEALAEAGKRNVPLFIDFYADWCAPCKMMDKQVYVDTELGKYYNENFVSVKLDVESEINANLVKEREITSMPTLLFVDAQGNSLSRVSSALDIQELMDMGQTVKGDVKNFEEIYDEYKEDKDDLVVMGELLAKAPSFVTIQTGANKQKWITRVNKIFEEYIDKKIVMKNGLINKSDYSTITTFYKTQGTNDRVIEYMVANFDQYLADVGEPVAFYIIRYNTELAEELAKNGDTSYMTHVERIKGDMKPVYSVVKNNDITSQYEMAKANCDALYALYQDKDVDTYITLKNKYFEIQGEDVSSMGLARAAQMMYESAGNNITNEQHEQAISWITKSLESNDMPIMNRINVIALLGDVYKKTDNRESAEKAYNQAYLESAQIEQLRSQRYIQLLLKRKIEMLKLE